MGTPVALSAAFRTRRAASSSVIASPTTVLKQVLKDYCARVRNATTGKFPQVRRPHRGAIAQLVEHLLCTLASRVNRCRAGHLTC